MIFQQIPHANTLGRKFDLALKRSKVNLRTSFEKNLVDLVSLMLYTKIQP